MIEAARMKQAGRKLAAAALWIIGSGLSVLSSSNLAFASASDGLSDVRFSDEARLTGRQIPDVELRLDDGRVMRLSALWRDRPLLLTLFYRRCTGTCEPLLFLMRDSVERIGGIGREYHVVGLSFAESDTAEDMRSQARALGLEHDPSWIFAVGTPQEIRRLAGALDFWFVRNVRTGQYDHPTLLVAIDRGRVIRALLGYPISHERIQELIWEVRGRFGPYYQLPGESRLRCFEYDARTGALRPDFGLLLLLAPGFIAIATVLGVFAHASRSR